LEKLARESLCVVAPTAIALVARDGEPWQASADSLPAATTTVTPLATSRLTAESIARLGPPPSDMLTTAGSRRLAATQSIAAMIQLV